MNVSEKLSRRSSLVNSDAPNTAFCERYGVLPTLKLSIPADYPFSHLTSYFEILSCLDSWSKSTFLNSMIRTEAFQQLKFNGAIVSFPHLSIEREKTAINMALSEIYELENPDAIIEFVANRQTLLPMLRQLKQQINVAYKSEYHAKLELVELDKDWKTLFVEISTSVNGKEGRKIIESLLRWLSENFPTDFQFVNVKNSYLSECHSIQ